MTTVRSAKNKGSAFEMDCETSLQQVFPDCYRTHERGYVMGLDLISKEAKLTFECKRLKGISWNQCIGFLDLLIKRSPEDYHCYLLFQSNRQPCLVMHYSDDKSLRIETFEDCFGVNFIKHLSSKKVLKTDKFI
jgi:hypothetical protein